MNCVKNTLLFWVCLCMSSTIFADSAPEWTIVPDKSSLMFKGTQNGAPVEGSFKKFTGTIFVDPANYQNSSIDIVVDMTSIATSYSEIASTLNTADWFDVKKFPKAEYKATKFNKIGDNKYQADGTLTIRDKSLPVVLTFTAVEDPKDTGTVEGDASLKRTEFGVGQGEWSSTDQVKDEVTVHFKAVATRKK